MAGVTDMWLPVDVKNGLGIWISQSVSGAAARGASRLMNQAHRHAQFSGPDTVKGSSRVARRAGTAAAVARLHDCHPHLTAASIGERLGVSERTVPGHWRPACSPAGPAASRGRIWSCPRWCWSPEPRITSRCRVLAAARAGGCVSCRVTDGRCLDVRGRVGRPWTQSWAAGQRCRAPAAGRCGVRAGRRAPAAVTAQGTKPARSPARAGGLA